MLADRQIGSTDLLEVMAVEVNTDRNNCNSSLKYLEMTSRPAEELESTTFELARELNRFYHGAEIFQNEVSVVLQVVQVFVLIPKTSSRVIPYQ